MVFEDLEKRRIVKCKNCFIKMSSKFVYPESSWEFKPTLINKTKKNEIFVALFPIRPRVSTKVFRYPIQRRETHFVILF